MKKILISILLVLFSIAHSGATLDSILRTGKPLKVLGLWCHPDDEFFMVSLAALKLPNVEITAFNLKAGGDEECLTGILNGATIYSRGCPCPVGIVSCPDTMAKFRLLRMEQAKTALGFKKLFYPLDSLILATSTAVATDSLEKWIKLLKPDILLTHNLAGDYISSVTNFNKRDHALVSALVTAAHARLTVKPPFYMSVYNYRRENGKLLQKQATGAPLPTDSIAISPNDWPRIVQIGQLYDGSGFYLDIARVGTKWRQNWFYRYY